MTILIGLAQSLALAASLYAASPQSAPPQVQPPARSPARSEGWTWMLYENNGPLVLANEIPDTPRLRTTLECAPGSSVAQLKLYGADGAGGFATVRSGSAAAEVEATVARGRLELAVRADHPVFAAFLSTGRLTITSGERETVVEIDRPNLPKLRRFAELCTG